jgi:hypothetical protein
MFDEEAQTVSFFRPAEDDHPRDVCKLPDSESFGIGFEEEVVLHLATGELRRTGEITGSYRL